LLLSYCFQSTMESARCEAISLLLHYLHLSAACWLTANSVRVYLWLARETAIERPATSRPIGLQSLAVLAWALPLLLVFVRNN
jgi:7 transmembrane receptor (Secretin family)